MDHAAAKHYAEAKHGAPSSFKFCGIEKAMMPTRGCDVLMNLAQRETCWLYTLRTVTPNGLNDDYSLKCFVSLDCL